MNNMKTYYLIFSKNLSLFAIIHAEFYEQKENLICFYDSYINNIASFKYSVKEELNSIFDTSYITLIVS